MENRSTWRTTPFTDRSPVSVGDWLRWGSRASLPTWHRVTRRTVDARVGVRQGSAPPGGGPPWASQAPWEAVPCRRPGQWSRRGSASSPCHLCKWRAPLSRAPCMGRSAPPDSWRPLSPCPDFAPPPCASCMGRASLPKSSPAGWTWAGGTARTFGAASSASTA